ncbi:hypothetical protein EV426DRAFT_601795 [Tirmania nivea]|nr:hypothetical protein EV426DRAFT_601795 [Tirmania nivea]
MPNKIPQLPGDISSTVRKNVLRLWKFSAGIPMFSAGSLTFWVLSELLAPPPLEILALYSCISFYLSLICFCYIHMMFHNFSEFIPYLLNFL